MDSKIKLSKNLIVKYLDKAQRDFTREDIIKYICDNNIEMVNFMYPAADGRLKTLNFVINDYDYLLTILTLGERVDGSSLFPFISASSSDLYVLPRFSTRLPKFRLSRCSAHSSTRTANPSRVPPNIFSVMPARNLRNPPA